MAKFKVDDRVEIVAGSKAGKKGKVLSSAPGPMGGEFYHVRLDDGSIVDAAERNLRSAKNSVRSLNAVVANALAWRSARGLHGRRRAR